MDFSGLVQSGKFYRFFSLFGIFFEIFNVFGRFLHGKNNPQILRFLALSYDDFFG